MKKIKASSRLFECITKLHFMKKKFNFYNKGYELYLPPSPYDIYLLCKNDGISVLPEHK